MADFRRVVTALAVVVLLMGLTATAADARPPTTAVPTTAMLFPQIVNQAGFDTSLASNPSLPADVAGATMTLTATAPITTGTEMANSVALVSVLGPSSYPTAGAPFANNAAAVTQNVETSMTQEYRPGILAGSANTPVSAPAPEVAYNLIKPMQAGTNGTMDAPHVSPTWARHGVGIA